MSRDLVLVDGYSIIYRGYFALLSRPLLNPQGRNSSSVFVFFRTLLQLTRERSPGFLAVAMDSRVPTFRHQRYPEYKATREKAPADLHAQVPVIEEIMAALGVPCVRADGFEADDVIATLSEECRKSGRPCWILSGDKDILQLIGGNVRLLAQERGATEIVEYSRERVFESKGVYPENIVDFLALAGDSSDNVPGVRGIGEKTALKLVSRFGSLDDMYARLGEVTPESVRNKLIAGRESAALSRELVTLRRDIPGLPSLDALAFGGFNADAALPLLEREGMKSIIAELSGISGRKPVTTPARASTAPGTYTTVISMEDLDAWLGRARAAGLFAFDVETDTADEMRAAPLGFSLSMEEGKACYIPIRASGVQCLPEQAVKERLAGLLEDPALRIVGQNFKFDYKVLRRWGVRPSNVHFDTMVAAWVLDSEAGSYGLDRMAEQRLGYRTMPYAEIVGKHQTLADLPIQQVTDYSGEDADLTLRLQRILSTELASEGLNTIFFEVELPLLTVLAAMELDGIRILSSELAAYGLEMEKDLGRLEQEIHELCGRKFNINSTKQLQEILFTWRKLTPLRKTKTGFSTDMDVLEALAAQDPVPEKILAHRKLSKLKSTYVDALPLLVNEQTGRLHTHYVQTGTATGRLSSKDPNLQNIPIREEEGRRIRSSFVPAAGMRFISADYAQIELAVLAHLSGDPILLKAFKEGKDIHRQTASLIFGTQEGEVSAEQRRVGKTINFGVIYGMSAYGLSQALRISKADAERFITTYFQRYEGVDRFLKQTIRSAEETGFVSTLLGRRRKIAGIRSQNRTEKAAAERIAVNTPVQGTAADIVKLAMVKLFHALRRQKLSTRILLQVHDEIILEAPEEEIEGAESTIREIMEHATEEDIPLKVQCAVGDSWGDFH